MIKSIIYSTESNNSYLYDAKHFFSMLMHPELEKVYITIEKYTIFQLKSIPVLIVCEDKKSYLNAG